MFFKQRIFLILIALFLNTCSMENEPYPYFVDVSGNLDIQEAKVNESQIQECIPRLGAFFGDYFTSSVQTQLDSKKQDSKTDKAFNCIVHTLIYFKRIVKGRSDVSGSFYKSSDLMNFLSTYVFPGKVNEGLVKELLKFKVLFVRGKTNVLTEAELTSLIGLVNFEFRRIFKNLETHIPVLNFKIKQIDLDTGDLKEQQKLRNEQAKQIEHAIAAFQREFSSLGSLIEKGYFCKDKICSPILDENQQRQSEKVSYQISSFRSLIREFSIATGYTQPFAEFDQTVNLTKIIVQLKSILFGGPPKANYEINQSEWKEIFTFFTSAYSLFIYYIHFSNNLWFVGHKVNQVYDIILNVINVLEKSLKERKKYTSEDSISNEVIYQFKAELDNLISNAQEKFNLDNDSLAQCKKDQKDLFKDAWSLVVDVFLDLRTKGSRGKSVSGLSLDKISIIRERINLWFIKQKYLEWYLTSLKAGKTFFSILDRTYDYSKFFKEKGESLHPKLSKKQALTYVSNNTQSFDFFREIAKNINFGFDSKWRMIVSNKEKDLELTDENIEQKKVALSLLNIESSVAEMFFTKFQKQFTESFSKEEFLNILLKKENKVINVLSHFESDKKELRSTLENIFLYMDLLLLSSDGGIDIDLKELTDFLHFLFSVYNSSVALKNSLQRNRHEPIVSGCNELSFDYKTTNTYLVENFAKEFSNFPNLVDYYNELSKKQGRILHTGSFETQLFIRLLWSFTYDKKENLSYSYIDDFITLLGVMHFVEFYMHRWDLDKNSFIDYGETGLAYRHFKTTLDEETQDLFESEDIFRYGVFYGELFLGSVNLATEHPLSSLRKIFYFFIKRFHTLCSEHVLAKRCACDKLSKTEYKKCERDQEECLIKEKNKCTDRVIQDFGKFNIKTDRQSLLQLLRTLQSF